MSNIFFKRTHSMACEFPEGCSCGTTEWNNMVDQLNSAHRELEDLRADRDTCKTEVEALTRQAAELRKDKERLEAAIKHERSALYIYRDRQNGTASHKDITTGIELLDAALYPRAAGEGKGAT